MTPLFDFDSLSWWLVPAASAILVATLATLVVSVWTVRRSNRMQVQMANLLILRDLSLRNSLLAKLPDNERAHIAGMIDEAFAEGGRVWGVSHLATILGDEGAKRLLDTRLGADPKEGAR